MKWFATSPAQDGLESWHPLHKTPLRLQCPSWGELVLGGNNEYMRKIENWLGKASKSLVFRQENDCENQYPSIKGCIVWPIVQPSALSCIVTLPCLDIMWSGRMKWDASGILQDQNTFFLHMQRDQKSYGNDEPIKHKRLISRTHKPLTLYALNPQTPKPQPTPLHQTRGS